MSRMESSILAGVFIAAPLLVGIQTAMAEPPAGGTLDPTTIPKFVTPLVIPPVMRNSGTPNDYDIAVRQFQQQILPGGIWNTLNGREDAFPPTTVWSYGPKNDPKPDSTDLGGGAGIAPALNSQFNYPAYTIETTNGENMQGKMVIVDWINDLVDDDGNYLPHLLPIDRSLHWANPEQLTCTDGSKTRDCRPGISNGSILQQPYNGPVPIVTHVHGAHVGPESDGYPEAWWLPDANNIPAGYATQGTLVNQYGIETNTPGVGHFTYPNDQPSTTLWYHDHTLGMTRNNVYAGPAGFWLIREELPDGKLGENGIDESLHNLPGPAPGTTEGLRETNVDAEMRKKYREIPIVIQDRSFNADGSLFYPGDRAFFEGIPKSELKIPFVGDPKEPSDIAPIWNPEAFFNVMVVNGVSWPTLSVEPDLYRFRLLNGCNSRFLNLSMFVVKPDGTLDLDKEIPFYQIGAEQSLLPKVVKISTGFKTALPGNGTIPTATSAESDDEALLMGLAERADVLVDFSGLTEGTVVRMINTAPDAPFGGFPDVPADPGTTGQIMQFTVRADTDAGNTATPPKDLVLTLPDAADPANDGQRRSDARDLALLEEESLSVCASIRPNGKIEYDKQGIPDDDYCVDKKGRPLASFPFGPKAAVLGTNGASGGTAQLWSDAIQQLPNLGDTETWELWNWSADAHPIHLHLVKFKVVDRQAFDPSHGQLDKDPRPPTLTEAGWKDTVIAYPGEVTRVNATFDTAGLYVWHCHIVEHEDNEMMVPFCVVGDDRDDSPGCNMVP